MSNNMTTQCAVIACAVAMTFATANAGEPTMHEVSVGSMTFSPENLPIELGDTVRFTWVGLGAHDVVQTTAIGNCTPANGGFMSGAFPGDLVGPGTVWEATFDEAFLAAHPAEDNVYPYMCSAHCAFGMRGVIFVETPEPECPADLTGDESVGVPDLLLLLAAWGANPGHAADLTGDGNVGVPDLLELLGQWGTCS